MLTSQIVLFMLVDLVDLEPGEKKSEEKIVESVNANNTIIFSTLAITVWLVLFSSFIALIYQIRKRFRHVLKNELK